MNLKREVELDIAINAGYLIALGEIDIRDSRELVRTTIPTIADEFLQVFEEEEHDYLEMVDDFSIKKLKEVYQTC